MTTLEDLRETLLARREQVEDPDRHLRPAAVRERVQVVRRRRATTVAVAAVLVLVAGVGGVAGLLRPDERLEAAGPVVLGLDVPRELRLHGFPYELTTTEDVAPGERVELPASEEQPAATLVARDLGAGAATLLADGTPVARVLADGLSAPTLVPAPARLEVRLDGADEGARVSVVLYTTTGELAPGVTDGTAVFRDEVAGERLITGAFSVPGAGEVEITYTGASAQTRIAHHCRAAGVEDAFVHVEVDGEDWGSSDCQGGIDAGAGGSWPHSDEGPARHTVRVWVTDGPDGPRIAADDVVVGVAAYERRASRLRALGQEVAQVVEHAGRAWRLVEVRAQPRSGGPFATTVDAAAGDVLLGLTSTGEAVGLEWAGGGYEGRSSIQSTAPGIGPGTGVDTLLLAGERYDVRVTSDVDAPFRAAVLVYRPL